MALTNHERVGKAMELLKSGLAPLMEREVVAKYGTDETRRLIAEFASVDRMLAGKGIAGGMPQRS